MIAADYTTERIVRVLLVEDEDLYRDLLRVVLSQKPRLTVVGAFADGESALSEAATLAPDVAILDIELGGSMNGVQLGLLLRRELPQLGIVLLSNHGDPEFISSLPREVMAGWSYLLKKSVSDVESLARAIEGAVAGFVVLDPQLVSRLQPRGGSKHSRLTPRQRAILALIAQGLTNAAIARQLVIAEKSVENQINAIYQELGIDRKDTSVQPRVKAVLTYLQESMYQENGPPSSAPRVSP
jgi:DNA-binding NarL/FixJ family response regulator